jgi:sulfate permease, SulP family
MDEPHKCERRKWPVVPVAVSLRGYQLAWLRGDLLAGITVAAFLVPQVMAYAQVAGVPPVAGLWAALPALVIYAALGSSRSLSMGPESTTALMTAVAIGPLAAGSPARYAGVAASLALLVGALSVCAGLARLGFVADLLSRPVLVGYLAGVGLIMIAGQLGRATGVRVSGSSVAAELTSFVAGLWRAAARHSGSGGCGAHLLVCGAVALASCAWPAAGHAAGHGGGGCIRAGRSWCQYGGAHPGRPPRTAAS